MEKTMKKLKTSLLILALGLTGAVVTAAAQHDHAKDKKDCCKNATCCCCKQDAECCKK
jgi:hypothetical protein